MIRKQHLPIVWQHFRTGQGRQQQTDHSLHLYPGWSTPNTRSRYSSICLDTKQHKKIHTHTHTRPSFFLLLSPSSSSLLLSPFLSFSTTAPERASGGARGLCRRGCFRFLPSSHHNLHLMYKWPFLIGQTRWRGRHRKTRTRTRTYLHLERAAFDAKHTEATPAALAVARAAAALAAEAGHVAVAVPARKRG